MLASLCNAKALMCAAGAVAVAGTDLPDYDKLGSVGLLLLAVLALWAEGRRKQAKLESIIESNTSALRGVTDALRNCERVQGNSRVKT